MHRMLRFCSAYCNRSASPITAREAIRVRSHGSRNGTGRSCFRACRGAGTNPEVEAVMLGLPLTTWCAIEVGACWPGGLSDW
jgi:hypothetical protein